MITTIRTTFKERLNTKYWLDEETKEKCREKVYMCVCVQIMKCQWLSLLSQ